MDSGRRQDLTGTDSGVETMQVGATGRLDYQADRSLLACRLGAHRLMNGRPESGAASPTVPADTGTAGTVTLLVMKLSFGRVAS
jgi:hypothetical protein